MILDAFQEYKNGKQSVPGNCKQGIAVQKPHGEQFVKWWIAVLTLVNDQIRRALTIHWLSLSNMSCPY